MLDGSDLFSVVVLAFVIPLDIIKKWQSNTSLGSWKTYPQRLLHFSSFFLLYQIALSVSALIVSVEALTEKGQMKAEE